MAESAEARDPTQLLFTSARRLRMTTNSSAVPIPTGCPNVSSNVHTPNHGHTASGSADPPARPSTASSAGTIAPEQRRLYVPHPPSPSALCPHEDGSWGPSCRIVLVLVNVYIQASSHRYRNAKVVVVSPPESGQLPYASPNVFILFFRHQTI